MRSFFNAVVFCRQGRETQNDVSDGGLAARIAVAMEQGEQEGAQAAVIVFPAKENPLPRNETILKNDVRVRVADVDPALYMFTLVLAVDGNM
jgi:hypothetical protein